MKRPQPQLRDITANWNQHYVHLHINQLCACIHLVHWRGPDQLRIKWSVASIWQSAPASRFKQITGLPCYLQSVWQHIRQTSKWVTQACLHPLILCTDVNSQQGPKWPRSAFIVIIHSLTSRTSFAATEGLSWRKISEQRKGWTGPHVDVTLFWF